jgi:hypothetical protein
MPRKNAANKGKRAQPAKDPLSDEEKQYIKDHMAAKPCLRCDDPVHAAISCTTVGYKGTRSWYAQLSLAKKKSADVHIAKYQDELEATKSASGPQMAPELSRPPVSSATSLEHILFFYFNYLYQINEGISPKDGGTAVESDNPTPLIEGQQKNVEPSGNNISVSPQSANQTQTQAGSLEKGNIAEELNETPDSANELEELLTSDGESQVKEQESKTEDGAVGDPEDPRDKP